jgi:hypothetical protein
VPLGYSTHPPAKGDSRMIEKIVFLWCDDCHAAGPTGTTTRAVRHEARTLGWLIRKPTQKHPHTTRALCPYCVMTLALVAS